MGVTHRKKWIIGGVSVSSMAGLLLLLIGDDREPIPPDLDARARYVGTAVVSHNVQAFHRLSGGEEALDSQQWYAAAQSTVPEVLRDPKLKVIYETDVKFQSSEKGTACVLVTAKPSDLELAAEVADDASHPEVHLLLYWIQDGAGEWQMDCGKCLRSFRMDRGANWSGRVGDRKNFRQVNQ